MPHGLGNTNISLIFPHGTLTRIYMWLQVKCKKIGILVVVRPIWNYFLQKGQTDIDKPLSHNLKSENECEVLDRKINHKMYAIIIFWSIWYLVKLL